MDDSNQNIETSISQVNFSVDAGIINRLGKELVGRAETAVSELVKNAYDADANVVEIYFVDSDEEGGTLEIKDDGHGMTREQLINGFMRLSSSDKFHNPISPKYSRVRAGKKGIGRFATQRLGDKLTILTKVKGSPKGIQLEIDWTRYSRDQDLVSIQNPIQEVDCEFEEGTHLTISNLRESWSVANIKRVFRYVSELLQPSFLSDRSATLNIAQPDQQGSFNTKFFRVIDGNLEIIADVDTMVFDNALGVIEGYVENNSGICEVVSTRFNINDTLEIKGNYDFLNNVHFKAYYFIYNYDWYEGYLPKMEFNRIADIAASNGGIKLYRNGFRVLPYGEIGNDWINIDKTSVKTEQNAYVPFNNINFFGFVEVVDPNGSIFEETSSREGLIENRAFQQLTDFVNRALRFATQRINSARLREKQSSGQGTGSSGANEPPNNQGQNDGRTTQEKLEGLKSNDQGANAVIDEAIQKLEEAEMLRVLAGIGLNIAEFTHEIRQFIPSFNGSIDFLISQPLPVDAKESLINLQDNFNRFRSYTAYIDYTITQNVNREKRPVDIISAIRSFHAVILKDIQTEQIQFSEDYYGFDLYTYPMHPSEWTSILYNLYTNSKKAIKRAKPDVGKIHILAGREDDVIYIEFMDNGDGVPQQNRNRIFDAFFTTTAPPSITATKNEIISGTGLGLKIVKDIISAYQGKIFLANPDEGFVTNFRIEIPEASEAQKEKYGY